MSDLPQSASRSERDETLRYLRGQHAAVMKRIEHYTTDGNGAPGFVEQLQRDARGIEASMQTLCATASEQRERKALEEIAQYTGEGPPTTPWQDIVRSLTKIAREAL